MADVFKITDNIYYATTVLRYLPFNTKGTDMAQIHPPFVSCDCGTQRVTAEHFHDFIFIVALPEPSRCHD